MTLFYLAVAWLVGIYAAAIANGNWWVWLAGCALCFTGLILVRRSQGWRLLIGCAFLFSLGALRRSSVVEAFDQNHIAFYNGQSQIMVEGSIEDAPPPQDGRVSLSVQARSITFSEGLSKAVSGLVLVQSLSSDQYQYGDIVRLTGSLETPPEFDSFSYKDYLARHNIYSLIRFAHIETTGQREGNPIWAALSDFRLRAYYVIKQLVPDPQASLLQGILLGLEGGISPDVRADFNAAGATHIIAISGSNLAIVAGLLQALFSRLVRKRWVALICIVGITFYAVFVGGEASVVRAAIMTGIGFTGFVLGRQTYGPASLGFGALAITLFDPRSLWDISFQLSFLATAGFIFFSAPLEKWLDQIVAKMAGRYLSPTAIGMTASTIAVAFTAQIATAPLIALYFGRISLASLAVNLLIVPAQTPIMVFGWLGVLAALIVWPVGQALAWISWLFLAYTTAIVRFGAALPGASLDVQDIPGQAVWLIYSALFGLAVISQQPEDKRSQIWNALTSHIGVKTASVAGLALAALIAIAAAQLPDGQLHIHFLDAGNNTAILIQTPSGRHILVGAEGSGRRLSASLGDRLPFWKRDIDLAILLDNSTDGIEALPSVMERYDIKAAIVGGVCDEEDEQSLCDELQIHGAQVMAAQSGMRLMGEENIEIRILRGAPDAGTTSSAVLMTFGDARILLIGNMGSTDIDALLNSGVQLDAAVLFLPATVSQATLDSHLIEAVSPEVVIFGKSPVEVDVETRERAGQIARPYYMNQSGGVELTSDGQHLWLTTER